MIQPQIFQLPPSGAFTEAQRRELNALLGRISQTTAPVIFGALSDQPPPGMPGRLFVQTVGGAIHLSLDTGTVWLVIV